MALAHNQIWAIALGWNFGHHGLQTTDGTNHQGGSPNHQPVVRHQLSKGRRVAVLRSTFNGLTLAALIPAFFVDGASLPMESPGAPPPPFGHGIHFLWGGACSRQAPQFHIMSVSLLHL